MVAVDTNVLIRLITRDHKEQAARADRVFAEEQLWVAKTVLLETNWGLRSLYGFATRDVAHVLTKLAGLANVHVEDPLAVAQALLWVESGLDFADGLHVASRGRAERFATFDTRLVKRAAKLEIATFQP